MRMAAAHRLLRVGALSLLPLLFTTCQHDSTAPQQVATRLAFTTAPTRATVANAFTPVVQVTALDAAGTPVPTFTASVTIAITTGTGAAGATLSGTTTVAASAGVATFPGLSIDKVGNGYTLSATSTGLTGATSASFLVDPGAAAQLVVTTEPGNATAGTAFPVQVTARDALGNTATGFTGNVTLTIGANPGSSTLGGTTTVAAVAGVANFSVSLNRPGSGYSLSASATGLPSVTSTGFNISVGAATQLAFTVQPSTETAGSLIAPAIVVAAQDQAGNTTASFTGDVTVALAANPGNGTLSGTLTVPLSGGIATFSTLGIDKSGTGYKLTATVTGLSSATSATFDVVAGPASKLIVTSQPGNTTAGAPITPAVVVTVQDALGNTATGFSGTVTMAIGTNPSGGTLAGTMSVTAASGIASFSALSIAQAGSGYTLVASSTGLTGATTPNFDIMVGVTAKLAFMVQPSATTASATIVPAVKVTVQDAAGNTITGFTGDVTMAIGTNPSGGTLSGTQTAAAVSGVATFSTLSINKVGDGYTLQAAAAGLPTATSNPFDIGGGTATQLVVTVQPGNATAGQVITPALEVTARDALGNRSTGFTGNVTVAITAATGTAGATLSGTKTVAAVAGVVTFSTLSIDKAGTGYTLTATAASVTSATSAAFDVAIGPATNLVFTVQPVNTTAGAAITPAVAVSVQDAVGNTVTSFTGNVTVAIGTNPGSGTLSGTTSGAAVSGVATFSTLSIDKPGTGYTLTASATGVTSVTSTAFNINPGTAATLEFTVQPTTTAAAATIAPPIQVTAKDALGNTATGFTGNVTVAITAGTGTAGATLSGTKVVAASAGVATFSTLSIDKSGTGYTLTATAASVTSTTSVAFDVATGSATKLAFTVQPVNTTAGAAITPAVAVTVQDAVGNTITSFTGNVTVAIGTNPSGGTLSGVTTVAAVAGVATFPGLSINKSGTGYTLTASATGFTNATSNAFNINPGTAATLEFTGQPTTTAAATTIAPPIQVTAKDALGNTATGFTGNVTVAITAGTGTAGATLSGTKVVAASAGVATFSTLSIDKAGNGYTLAATATGPTSATSTAFDIVVGNATKLVFTVQPSTATAGATIAPPVQVTAQDAGGNTVTAFSGSVTVAITSGTGTAGATLSGTTTVGAVSGVATFSTLSINKSGTGYRLTATATGPTAVQSNTFNINTGPATLLGFTVQPVNTAAGSSITPAVKVAALDAAGNTVTTFTSNISVVIGANPGSGVLSGTTSVAAVAGVATFSNLSINKTGTSYTLIASATGLTNVSSATFNIVPGAAAKLAFLVQPVSTAALAPITPAVQVVAQDNLGNTATGFTGNVAMAIGTNPAAGTLSGTLTKAAVGGIAVFSDLSINQVGVGYTLRATSGALTAAVSATFDITGGSNLKFTVQPTTTTAGATITPAVQVTARDGNGNTLTLFTGNVTIAILAGTGSPGATLAGTTTVAAVAGVATFSNLSIAKSGSGYKLTATASGFTAGTSSQFTINPGTPVKLGFITQPSTTPAGSIIIPGPEVAVQDALGNTVKGISGTITVAIGTNPASGTLSGTLTGSISAGVASFPNLSINNAGSGYTLVASSTGYTNGTSASFTITAAATIHLAFTVQPVATTAGLAITPAVQVTARDGANNTVTSFTGSISIDITSGAGPNGATLSGTKTITAVNGVATFSDLSITKAGSGYKLSVEASGVAGATSTSFVINPAAAAKLSFGTQPTSTTVNTTISPAPTVDVLDAFNNLVTSFVGNVTVALGTNPTGAMLNGTKTVAVVAGTATFSTLSVTLAGTGYDLAATSSGLTAASSSGFNIN